MRAADPLQRVLRNFLRQRMKNARPLAEHELARPAIVFAPHPDDETLACGGTILRKVRAGARVQVVFLTDGSASHAAYLAPAQLADIRCAEALAACQTLGVPAENVAFLNLRDGHLQNSQAEAVTLVVERLLRFQPEEIFLPYRDEPPADHAAAYQIIRQALNHPALAGLPRPVMNEYPVWFWYHWPWVRVRQGRRLDTLNVLLLSLKTLFGLRMAGIFQHAVDIRPVLREKRCALAEHRSQMENLTPGRYWPTLGGVSGGQFLDCFFQEHEFFYRNEP